MISSLGLSVCWDFWRHWQGRGNLKFFANLASFGGIQKNAGQDMVIRSVPQTRRFLVPPAPLLDPADCRHCHQSRPTARRYSKLSSVQKFWRQFAAPSFFDLNNFFNQSVACRFKITTTIFKRIREGSGLRGLSLIKLKSSSRPLLAPAFFICKSTALPAAAASLSE